MITLEIGWRQAPSIALIAFSIWGLGVSVGRFIRAAETPDTLAQKLTHICSNYHNVHSSVICQTVFAANFKDDDWTEAAPSRVPQERLDAKFLDFISSFVSLQNEDLLGAAACEVATTIPDAICSVNSTLAISTKQVVQIQYKASKVIMNRPTQSRFLRTLPFVATTSTWVWKWMVFSSAGLFAGSVFGARYFFWPWVCFPWIWFFKDASASYILIWYSLGSFVVYDMSFMQYKVSRTLISMYLIAVSCMLWAWFVVKGSREVRFSLFCFLAVAVPLDPFFDWALAYIAPAFQANIGATPIAQ